MPAIKPPWGITTRTVQHSNWRLGGNELVGFWPFNIPTNIENSSLINGPVEAITSTIGQRTLQNASIVYDALQVNGRTALQSSSAGTAAGIMLYTPSPTGWFERSLPIAALARVRVTTVAAINPIWSNNYATGGTFKGAFLHIDSSGKLNCGYGDATTSTLDTGRRYKTGTTVLVPNTYYDLACVVRSALDMSLYVNGVDDGGAYTGTGTSMAYSGITSLAIGGGNGFGVTGLKGSVDYAMQLGPASASDTDIAQAAIQNIQADPWALVPSTNAVPWMSKKRLVRLAASKPLESWTGNFGATAFVNAPPLRYYGWPA